jgi:hypothetical protein
MTETSGEMIRLVGMEILARCLRRRAKEMVLQMIYRGKRMGIKKTGLVGGAGENRSVD